VLGTSAMEQALRERARHSAPTVVMRGQLINIRHNDSPEPLTLPSNRRCAVLRRSLGAYIPCKGQHDAEDDDQPLLQYRCLMLTHAFISPLEGLGLAGKRQRYSALAGMPAREG